MMMFVVKPKTAGQYLTNNISILSSTAGAADIFLLLLLWLLDGADWVLKAVKVKVHSLDAVSRIPVKMSCELD